MKTSPPTTTSPKINPPSLLGFFDSFSWTECLGWWWAGAAAIAVEAIVLLSFYPSK
jgi:hypothetical protein